MAKCSTIAAFSGVCFVSDEKGCGGMKRRSRPVCKFSQLLNYSADAPAQKTGWWDPRAVRTYASMSMLKYRKLPFIRGLPTRPEIATRFPPNTHGFKKVSCPSNRDNLSRQMEKSAIFLYVLRPLATTGQESWLRSCLYYWRRLSPRGCTAR